MLERACSRKGISLHSKKTQGWGDRDGEPVTLLTFSSLYLHADDAEYKEALKGAMQNRVDAVKGFAEKNSGYDKLPDEALAAVQKLVDALS